MTYPPPPPGPHGAPGGQPPPHAGIPGPTHPYGGHSRPPQQFGMPPYGTAPSGHVAWPAPAGPGGGPPPPRKKRTAVVLALVLAVAVLLGGGVAAVLLLDSAGGERQQSADPPAPTGQQNQGSAALPPPQLSTTGTSGSDTAGEPAPGGQPSNEDLAAALFNAFATQDSRAFADLVCRSIAQADQSRIAPGATAEPNGTPTDDGTTGTIPVAVTVDGKTSAGSFQSKREAGRWCLTGAS
jgi:hypothetical protein